VRDRKRDREGEKERQGDRKRSRGKICGMAGIVASARATRVRETEGAK
jgi:hypothetical protein